MLTQTEIDVINGLQGNNNKAEAVQLIITNADFGFAEHVAAALCSPDDGTSIFAQAWAGVPESRKPPTADEKVAAVVAAVSALHAIVPQQH